MAPADASSERTAAAALRRDRAAPADLERHAALAAPSAAHRGQHRLLDVPARTCVATRRERGLDPEGHERRRADLEPGRQHCPLSASEPTPARPLRRRCRTLAARARRGPRGQAADEPRAQRTPFLLRGDGTRSQPPPRRQPRLSDRPRLVHLPPQNSEPVSSPTFADPRRPQLPIGPSPLPRNPSLAVPHLGAQRGPRPAPRAPEAEVVALR